MSLAERLPQVLAWKDVHEGLSVNWDFTIGDAEMSQFAALSRDYNPLHTDDSFARAKGFEGRVVYGALLTAQISRLVGMEVPGRDGVFVGMSVNFRQPVYVGQTVQFRAEVVQISDAASAVSLKFTMRIGERLVAKGTVDALMRHA